MIADDTREPLDRAKDYPPIRPRWPFDRVRSDFLAQRPVRLRIMRDQLRERCPELPAAEIPVERRRAVAMDAARRGYYEWEVGELLGGLTELEAAWFRANRRVTA